MFSARLLLVSALLGAIIIPSQLACAQNDAAAAAITASPDSNNGEAAAVGYSSYVSAMEKQQSINDMKETATYSWAKVSYKNAEATQLEAASATSSIDAVETPEASQTQEAVATAPAAATQATGSNNGSSKKMMPIGIGIAFGVLALIVGLVTSMIIYNRRKARRDFARRTQGLQQMAEASV